jgi:hypothetical protein
MTTPTFLRRRSDGRVFEIVRYFAVSVLVLNPDGSGYPVLRSWIGDGKDWEEVRE